MRATKTLRIELPVEVWERLAAEAADKGVLLGTYARQLIVARDERLTSKR